MDGRDAFLTMARDRHYEFSSLRRCKYSTLALLYELHTQVMVRHLTNLTLLPAVGGVYFLAFEVSQALAQASEASKTP